MQRAIPSKNRVLLAGMMAMVCPLALHADIVPLFEENYDAFDAATDFGDGSTFGVETLPAPTTFGTGDAMRMYDLSTLDKPELQGELAAPLLEPFRIDFQSLNQSTNASTKAIRFRMANSGDSITSESRSAFSLSWQADGKFTAKYSDHGVNDGTANDVDTKSSDPLVGVQGITMVANGQVTGTYSYSLFGESRTLNPLSYDVYVDGVLLNDSSNVWESNGLAFHVEKSVADYDPTLGIQRFGILGSSNSDVDPDYQYDNFILRTGADIIPEPSALALLGLAGGVLAVVRRRRLG